MLKSSGMYWVQSGGKSAEEGITVKSKLSSVLKHRGTKFSLEFTIRKMSLYNILAGVMPRYKRFLPMANMSTFELNTNWGCNNETFHIVKKPMLCCQILDKYLILIIIMLKIQKLSLVYFRCQAHVAHVSDCPCSWQVYRQHVLVSVQIVETAAHLSFSKKLTPFSVLSLHCQTFSAIHCSHCRVCHLFLYTICSPLLIQTYTRTTTATVLAWSFISCQTWPVRWQIKLLLKTASKQFTTWLCHTKNSF